MSVTTWGLDNVVKSVTDAFNKGLSNVVNKQLFDVQGRNIGYSTYGHAADLCNAIAHIKPEYYGIPPKEWYTTDDWTGFMIPVSKYCMQKKITPKWAVVNAATGQVTLPAPLPAAPAYVYTPQADGQLKETTTGYAPSVGDKLVDAVTGGIKSGVASGVSGTTLLIGAGALIAFALLSGGR